MKDDRLSEARYALRGHVRCAVCRPDGSLHVSEDRGVLPMLLWLDEDRTFLQGASVADKIVGRAAAMLMVYGGVSEIYASVISRSALDYLREQGVEVSYTNTCIAISNRRGDGICPMERAVAPVSDPEKAFEVLKEKCLGHKV